MFDVLAERRINLLAVSTSEIKVSALIAEAELELAVRVLHTMAAQGWTTRAAVLQRYGIKRRQDIYPARERLLRLGLVEQDRGEGGWSIVDPLFATWLRRRPGLPA